MTNCKPIVWTIAGSDSGGGAGIQADLLTFNDLKTFGCTVITAVTAQNSLAVNHVELLPPTSIRAQLETLHSDLPPAAVKIGMVGSNETAHVISELISNLEVPIILDPVLFSTTGNSLSYDLDLEVFKNSLFKKATLVTPNIPEAETLTQISIKSIKDVINAAQILLEQGAKSVIIKGGHADTKYAQDYWTDGKESFWLHVLREPTQNTHGSGCTFSAAITSALALGYSMHDALVIAKMYVTQGIRNVHQCGAGAGSVSHFGWPEHPSTLPTLSNHAMSVNMSLQFPNCGEEPLGFYPIVDTSEWVGKLAEIGVRTIQLRIKNKNIIEVEKEIKAAVELAELHKARLFINDYWQLAIKHNAYGVHLGQEDLATADLAAIAKAKLRLGISTHSHAEVARAYAIKPSYIAFGPIYPTTSKVMKYQPQGITQLKQWSQILHCPLVAIGGINENNLADVLATGVDGVAVISAILQAHDPIETARNWLELIGHNHAFELTIF